MPRFRRLLQLPGRTTRQIECEIDEELRFHLDMRAAELVESGMGPAAAREEARRRFGDLDATRAYCRAQDLATEKATRRSTLLHQAREELLSGVHFLRRRAGFAPLRHESFGDTERRHGREGGIMESRSRRARAFRALDHALPLLGVILLLAGQIQGGWLTPLGWIALGLAAVARLAEWSGYSIPRPGRTAIVGLGCADVPLAFGVSRGGQHFLFTRAVERPSDPWPDEYAVYELPAMSWLQVASSFAGPPAGARRLGAAVPTRDLRFEHHERSYVDGASLRRALARVVPTS